MLYWSAIDTVDSQCH